MPYAIKYTSILTEKTNTGPILMKKIEKPLVPVIFKNMTKEEAEEFCDRIDNDPTYSNAHHVVVKV